MSPCKALSHSGTQADKGATSSNAAGMLSQWGKEKPKDLFSAFKCPVTSTLSSLARTLQNGATPITEGWAVQHSSVPRRRRKTNI